MRDRYEGNRSSWGRGDDDMRGRGGGSFGRDEGVSRDYPDERRFEDFSRGAFGEGQGRSDYGGQWGRGEFGGGYSGRGGMGSQGFGSGMASQGSSGGMGHGRGMGAGDYMTGGFGGGRGYGNPYDFGPGDFQGQSGFGSQGFRRGEHGGGWSSEQDRFNQQSDWRGRAQFDDDYNFWRNEQVRKFDKDYEDWRHERRQKFSDEFDKWRSSRMGQEGEKTSTHAGSKNK